MYQAVDPGLFWVLQSPSIGLAVDGNGDFQDGVQQLQGCQDDILPVWSSTFEEQQRFDLIRYFIRDVDQLERNLLGFRVSVGSRINGFDDVPMLIVRVLEVSREPIPERDLVLDHVSVCVILINLEVRALFAVIDFSSFFAAFFSADIKSKNPIAKILR